MQIPVRNSSTIGHKNKGFNLPSIDIQSYGVLLVLSHTDNNVLNQKCKSGAYDKGLFISQCK